MKVTSDSPSVADDDSFFEMELQKNNEKKVSAHGNCSEIESMEERMEGDSRVQLPNSVPTQEFNASEGNVYAV